MADPTNDLPSPELMQGVAKVLAELARTGDQHRALELMDHFKMSVTDFVRAGVDESDLEALRQVVAFRQLGG